MTARVAEAIEGRPPTTIDGLSRALAKARDRNVELVVELRAERAEGVALARLAFEGANRVAEYAIDRPDVAIQYAGRIASAATRFVRQRSSHVL